MHYAYTTSCKATPLFSPFITPCFPSLLTPTGTGLASQQVLEELKARARLSKATRTLLAAAALPNTFTTETLVSWGYRLLRGGWWMTRAEQRAFVSMLAAIGYVNT